MHNKKYLYDILHNNRKVLYIVLLIIMISVFTLTVVYAALSTTLNINGNAEISAASWDIYLDNIRLNSQSVTSNVPTITDKMTASFSTTLSKPGDFYEFCIDVVNNGTIDAMIDSVTKTPDLSDTQKKYLNYIVEYQNGELITAKQLVLKKSYVRLRIRVEFRKDIASSDLPTQSETLDFSFKVNYTQIDNNSENVTIDNNGKLIKMISGDLETVGSEIAIGNEHFYIIKNDGSKLTLFSKYNLYVGNSYDGNEENVVVPLENPTGIQDERAIGVQHDADLNAINFPYYGTTFFSLNNYWKTENGVKDIYATDNTSVQDLSLWYVYDSNSTLYSYVENYKNYLSGLGVNIFNARLIKRDELIHLGCGYESRYFTCALSEYPWVLSTSFWTGSANEGGAMAIFKIGYMVSVTGDLGDYFGVRPVIEISLSEISS